MVLRIVRTWYGVENCWCDKPQTYYLARVLFKGKNPAQGWGEGEGAGLDVGIDSDIYKMKSTNLI